MSVAEARAYVEAACAHPALTIADTATSLTCPGANAWRERADVLVVDAGQAVSDTYQAMKAERAAGSMDEHTVVFAYRCDDKRGSTRQSVVDGLAMQAVADGLAMAAVCIPDIAAHITPATMRGSFVALINDEYAAALSDLLAHCLSVPPRGRA